jgi:hypothetical protein
MAKFLKIFRIILIVILSIIIFLTTYFIIDRYVFNPNMKGISPVDIKDVLKILILPLTLMIIGTKLIENKIKK